MDWVPMIQYYPEPPRDIRGAMNPWALERQRLIFAEEEKIWAKITGYKREWVQLRSHLEAQINNYNAAINALNDRIAESGGSGFMGPLNMAGMVAGIIPGFSAAGLAIMGIKIISMGVDLVTGRTRKLQKDIENWQRDVMRLAEDIDATNGRLEAIQRDVVLLTNRIPALQSSLDAQQRLYTAQAESAYLNKQSYELQSASRHQALVRQAVSLPQRRMSNDLF